MHRSDDSPTSEEIHAAATQLARARSGEDKPTPILRFKQRVDDVEQLRDPLDFVHDHRAAFWRSTDEVSQAFWPCLKLARKIGLQEIDEERVGHRLVEPGGLAGP